MRPHECPGTTGYFFTLAVDQPGIGDKYPAFTTNPATFGYYRPRLERLGEEQIEGSGQDEAVRDQTVGSVEGGIIEHFEIGRAVHCPRCVIIAFVDIKKYSGRARFTDFQPRIEQAVYRSFGIKPFEGAKMSLRAAAFQTSFRIICHVGYQAARCSRCLLSNA